MQLNYNLDCLYYSCVLCSGLSTFMWHISACLISFDLCIALVFVCAVGPCRFYEHEMQHSTVSWTDVTGPCTCITFFLHTMALVEPKNSIHKQQLLAVVVKWLQHLVRSILSRLYSAGKGSNSPLLDWHTVGWRCTYLQLRTCHPWNSYFQLGGKDLGLI